MRFFKLKLIFLFLSFITLNAYDINDKVIYQKDFENKTIYLPLNNYRTLIFEDRIKSIQLTNSENITAEFVDNKIRPLQMLKILGKNIGSESAVVILENDKLIQINFSIMKNLDNIITIVKNTYPNLIVEQANDTLVLKGYVKDYKEKDLVIEIFKKAGVDIEKNLVNMIETSSPSKMIKIKMYAVEINNDNGIDLKNNWTLSSKNYMKVNGDNGYVNYPSSSYGRPYIERDVYYDDVVSMSDPNYNPDLTGTIIRKEIEFLVDNQKNYQNVNNQRNEGLDDALQNIISSAVTLTGGLTGVANYLGKNFNAGLMLNYLSTEGVANVLDETTLLTLENKNATFHAGGTIMIKTQTTSAEGLPNSTIEPIDYGLQLDFKAKNIMKNEYIDLEIDTKSTQIDWTNQVDGIPSFLEKKIKTNVLAQNGHTIVIGGLVNNENSNDISKIPLLGDIPILGFLFKSKSFKEGKSELVFFVTPEIVSPENNNQEELLKKTSKKILDTSRYKKSLLFDNDEDKKSEKKKKEKVLPETTPNTDTSTTKPLNHKEIVDKIYGR
ncbi:MAG: hypothetical protein ACNI25_12865 [Halarcobacter sp.]